VDMEFEKLTCAHRADQRIVSNLYSGDYGTFGSVLSQDLGDFPTVLVELKFTNMTLDGWVAKAELNEFSFLRGVSRCLGASIEELGAVSARPGVVISLSFQSKIPPAQINGMLDSAGFNLFAGTSLSKDFFSSTCSGKMKGAFLQQQNLTFQAAAKSLADIAVLQAGVQQRDAVVSKLEVELNALSATLKSTIATLDATSQGKGATESRVVELQAVMQKQEQQLHETMHEMAKKQMAKNKARQLALLNNFCLRYTRYEILQGWRTWKKKVGKYKSDVIKELTAKVARQSADIADLDSTVQGLRCCLIYLSTIFICFLVFLLFGYLLFGFLIGLLLLSLFFR
jgi:hypothetical protein